MKNLTIISFIIINLSGRYWWQLSLSKQQFKKAWNLGTNNRSIEIYIFKNSFLKQFCLGHNLGFWDISQDFILDQENWNQNQIWTIYQSQDPLVVVYL